MKHFFASGKSDNADATLINPSNWNDVHTYAITALSANTSLLASHDLVVVTVGTATIVLTLPLANVRAGLTLMIKRPASDNGVGVASITPAGTDTIENLTSALKLVNGGQYVKLVADGTSNWHVIGGN